MAETFSRSVLKVVIAQICQTMGWHAIHTTPLEIMVDMLQRYIKEIGTLSHLYSEQFGHTLPNLDDVGLAFRDMHINVADLEEYIRNVDSVPCVYDIPKYPIPKDSHLNFLKPGSREVVTRPVHVHEHLPPMHPEMEEEEYGNKQTPLSIDTAVASGSTSPLPSPKGNVFKRPGDPISLESPAVKRARLMLEEEGRPLREISSVMMTTSGFLSPAREGKLPESRTPLQPSDSRSNSPQPTSYPMVPPEVKGDKKTKKLPFKKTADGIKKIGDKENKKKDHKVKDLAKVDKHMPTDESKVKKLVSMKELKKLKALKSGALKMMAHASTAAGPSTSTKLPKLSPPKITTSKTPNLGTPKMSKPAGQQKTPKMDKCFPLPPMIPQPKALSPEKCKDTGIVEGKLSSEPDKLKLNIFKKISKAKEEKPEKVDRTEHFDPPSRDSRESSPGLIIDESEANSRQREVRMAQIDDCIESVIQRSVEIADEEAKYQRDRKSPTEAEISSSKVDETINDVVSGHASGPGSENDVYMFDDDFSPPGTPSTPRTPELPMPSRKVQEPKEKKRKRDKSKSKKEGKGKSKVSFSPKKMKAELLEPDPYERPKTPEAPDHREPHHPPPPVFPFFPYNPPAPGLIPPPLGHPYFPRFPLPLGKNLPHPAMPNLPLPPPLFMQKKSEEVAEPKEKPAPEKPSSVAAPCPVVVLKQEKIEKPLPPPPPPPVKEKSGEKKVKEHKKKEKDKAKKKKDKKEKIKGKDKSEKKKIKFEKKEKEKDKLKEKKERKEKKKEKEKEIAAAAAAAASAASASTSITPTPPLTFLPISTSFGESGSSATPSASAASVASAPATGTMRSSSPAPPSGTTIKREEKGEMGVPKITFRLGPPSPRPPTPDAQPRKIVIKPVVKSQDEGNESAPVSDVKREPSPELARISALITRPPKQKSSSKTAQPKQENISEPVAPPTISIPTPTVPRVGSTSSPTPTSGSSPILPKSKKGLAKRVQKIKGKEITKKMGMTSETEPTKEPVPFYYDDKGNKIWICPECEGQDDGSPMIGCDGCDAWYHWVCVGIQVPPDVNEDWYCRVCIVKKQQESIAFADKRKKSRKKKVVA